MKNKNCQCLQKWAIFGPGEPPTVLFWSLSSDFPLFLRFAILLFVNTPICSDWFRLAPIYPDLFRFVSEQIRETPFCRPLLQVPDWSGLRLPLVKRQLAL